MIRYLRHSQINLQKWDALINQSLNGNIYAYTWYLNHLGKWDALVCGDYEAVLPLVYNRKWLGFRQIYQPYFCQQLGVFSRNPIDQSLMDAFLAIIPKKFVKVHFQCNEGNPKPRTPRFQYTEKVNFVLDLSPSYGALFAQFSKSLRQRIRKAKTQLSIQKNSRSPEKILSQYASFLGENGRKINWKKAQKSLETALVKEQAFSCTAYAENGVAIASVFFLKSHQRLTYLIGVSSAEGKKQFAIHALLDQLIQQYSGQEYELDFEGSSINSLAYFFGSFGAERRSFWQVASI